MLRELSDVVSETTQLVQLPVLKDRVQNRRVTMASGHTVPEQGRTKGVQTLPSLGPTCSGCGAMETHYLGIEGRTDAFICLNCQHVEEREGTHA